MARDYRRIYPGRNLLTTEIKTGSLAAIFTDLLSAISGANTIIEFGKSITQAIDSLRMFKAPSYNLVDEQPVGRTIEKLLQTAERANAKVNLRIETPRGKKLLVRFDPGEAVSMSDSLRKSKVNKKKGRPKPRPSPVVNCSRKF